MDVASHAPCRRINGGLSAGDATTARYFNLGKSLGNRAIFSVFWTDGKKYRVVLARDMTPEETNYYDRKNSEMTF